MFRHVVSATPDTPAEELVRVMLEDHVSGLPVLRDGRVVGVFSDGDLMGTPAVSVGPVMAVGGGCGADGAQAPQPRVGGR
jgi:CBS domain-containing protein